MDARAGASPAVATRSEREMKRRGLANRAALSLIPVFVVIVR